VLVTSRSYDEYLAMFALQPGGLSGLRVLDCSAGASSFVTNARRAGCVAVAVDPAYALAKDALAQTAGADNSSGAGIAVANADRFTWSWYGGREQRDRMRARALAEFVLDVAVAGGRYVAAALPQLPFRDLSFDLALCSHLLFTWADQLGRGWHLAALRELSRVAREVRVFPTLVQGRGDLVPFWPELMADLAATGIRAETRRVDYEFQVGGNQMLVLAAR
jgi:SAM-dependent methyltransferase